MNRAYALAIARRILQQFRHDRRTLGLLFIAPLVILSLLDLLVRGGTSVPQIDVVRADSGPVATAVTASLDGSPLVAASDTDLESAAADLAAQRIAAYVVFPAGFSSRAIGEGVLAPEIHLEGTQPGLSQPVLLAVTQSITGTVRQFAGTSGVRIPTVNPEITYLHGGPSLDTLDYFGAAFIGLIVFFLVFVITIVSFLRERTQGTLERLMASPLRRADIVVGYMTGFAVVAFVQAVIVLLFSLYVLHIHNEGNIAIVALIALLMTLGAVNLGVLLSLFARTEFQAVQFIPIVIVPQFLLSGVLVPISSEPHWLQYVSNVLPLTYGVAGLRDVMLRGLGIGTGSVGLDIGVLAVFVIVLIVGAALTLRREVA